VSDKALEAVRYLCITAVTLGIVIGSVLERRRKP